MKNVIGGWVLLVTGLTQDALLWSDSDQPRPAGPYVGLTRRTFAPFAFDTDATTEVPVAATATVTANVAGETATLLLGKRPLSYTLVGADDAEVARDQLLAQAALTYEPVTATANGADKIDVVGKGSQAVFVTPVEGVTVLETLEYRRHTLGLRRAIVRISLMGFSADGADIDNAADEYADALIASLMSRDEPGSTYLRENSVGVENQANINVQNVSINSPGAGGIREQRLIFDVQFNAGARRYFPENPVDGVVPPIVEVSA